MMHLLNLIFGTGNRRQQWIAFCESTPPPFLLSSPFLPPPPPFDAPLRARCLGSMQCHSSHQSLTRRFEVGALPLPLALLSLGLSLF